MNEHNLIVYSAWCKVTFYLRGCSESLKPQVYLREAYRVLLDQTEPISNGREQCCGAIFPRLWLQILIQNI